MVIDIPVIKDLALTASIGVAVLILTNLILLPVLLSYIGVSPAAAARSLRAAERRAPARGFDRLWSGLERFVERRWAIGAIVVAAVLTGCRLGRPATTSRSATWTPARPSCARARATTSTTPTSPANYALSSDAFAVIVKTPPEGCLKYQTLVEVDRLAWALQQLPGVQTTVTLANAVRQITAGSYEGSPKWLTIARNQDVLNYGAQQASVNNPDLFNTDCSVMPVIAYLADHRAETLDRVVQASADFAEAHSTAGPQFLLAAGSAGIEAATNIVVRKAWTQMLLLVYAAVVVLCFITFRSWRAVVVAVVPLVVTSVLCEALMVCAGHRRQGGDAAGDRARRRHRHRLRAVPAERAAGAAARSACRCARPTGAPCSSPARWSRWSASRWPPAWRPGRSRRSSSRPTWASCSRSCSSGTWSARWC